MNFNKKNILYGLYVLLSTLVFINAFIKLKVTFGFHIPTDPLGIRRHKKEIQRFIRDYCLSTTSCPVENVHALHCAYNFTSNFKRKYRTRESNMKFEINFEK